MKHTLFAQKPVVFVLAVVALLLAGGLTLYKGGVMALAMDSSPHTSGTTMADRIQEIALNGGHTAWLIETPNLPMISVEAAFRAGSAYEPAAQNGVASFMANLLDQGADDLNDKAFQEAVEDIGMRFGAGAGLLNVSVNMTTLTEHADGAFDLFRKALTKPHFSEEAAERTRRQMMTGLKREQEDTRAVANRLFYQTLYAGHPYSRSASGALDTVKTLTAADAKAYFDQQMHAGNMVISVVGDISARQLKKELNKLIALMPEGKERNPDPAQTPKDVAPQTVQFSKNVPQSDVVMGHGGISREDPDYYAVQVLNTVLGGGGMKNRLFDEVREKRGLVYYVFSSFVPLPGEGPFVISGNPNNKDVKTFMEVVIEQLEDLRSNGATEEEFNDAKAYLAGSFPLRLDSNAKLLGYLTAMQLEELGKDYVDNWVANIEAISQADVNRVAKRLLNPDYLIRVVVGGR